MGDGDERRDWDRVRVAEVWRGLFMGLLIRLGVRYGIKRLGVGVVLGVKRGFGWDWMGVRAGLKGEVRI